MGGEEQLWLLAVPRLRKPDIALAVRAPLSRRWRSAINQLTFHDGGTDLLSDNLSVKEALTKCLLSLGGRPNAFVEGVYVPTAAGCELEGNRSIFGMRQGRGCKVHR